MSCLSSAGGPRWSSTPTTWLRCWTTWRSQRAVVAGLSMGGYIAFAFWRRHRERVQALVLLDTRAEPDAPQAKANRDAAAIKVRQAGSAAIAGEMLPRLLAPANLSNQRIVERAQTMMAEQPVEGVAGALAGLRDRADSRPTLPTISVPTLVLVGEHDVLTPPADAAAMAAAIPGAHVVVIPGPAISAHWRIRVR